MNFLQSLSPTNIPDPTRQRDAIQIQREILLQWILYLIVLVSSIGLFFAVRMLENPDLMGIASLFIVAFILFATMAFFRNLPYLLRSAVVLGLFSGAALAQILLNGLNGPGILLLFISVVLANLLFNTTVGGLAFFSGIILMAVVAVQMVTGKVPAPTLNEFNNSTSFTTWGITGITFILGGMMAVTSIHVITRGMLRNIRSLLQMDDALVAERTSLEQRVKDRSTELQKRLSEFEVAGEIAREISSQNNLESLLNNAVNLIRERFGFYHAGIFLNDDKDEYAVLRAATGHAGQQMIERNHRLKIGEIGIVGNVVSRGEARIALDVADDVVHYKNPLLPDTRSEMGLPLRVAGKTIGALDVQSVLENAFSQDDVKILQTVADQLAIAVEKSRLVEELQRSVAELESSHNLATRKVWQGHLKSARRKFAYRYNRSTIENDAEETEYGKRAIQTGQRVMAVVDRGQQKKVTAMALPIKLRNQVLGVIDIQFESSSVSPDLVALIEGTVDRLAISLENARLLEEIQYRAERERLVGEITSRVRSASDVDSILRITAQEIGRSLGVSEVMVQLRSVDHS